MDKLGRGPATDIISTGIAFLAGFYLAKIDDGHSSPIAILIVVIGLVIISLNLYRLIKDRRKPHA